MLDGQCSFQTLDHGSLHIWWGAFLGMPEQVLVTFQRGLLEIHCHFYSVEGQRLPIIEDHFVNKLFHVYFGEHGVLAAGLQPGHDQHVSDDILLSSNRFLDYFDDFFQAVAGVLLLDFPLKDFELHGMLGNGRF